MTTLFQTQNLLWIVPVIILAGLCYSLWKAGRYREPDKEIYEKELRSKCPYDQTHCEVIGILTSQDVVNTCGKCSRYKNWQKQKS